MYEFINLDENDSLYPNITKPDSYILVERIAFYEAWIIAILNISLLIILLSRLQRLAKGDLKRYVLLLMIGNIFFSLLHNILAIVHIDLLVDLSDNLPACAWLLKFNGTFYIFSSWFLYLILIEREEVARRGLENLLGKRDNLDWLRTLVRLTARYIVPVFAIVCLFFFQGRWIFSERTCDSFIPTFSSASMGVADTLLSLGLLFMFISPVLQISNRSQLSKESDLYKVLTKNLFWSSVMIGTTCFSLFTMTIQLVRVEKDDDPDIQWRRPFAWVLANADLFINSVAVLAIYPGAWLDEHSFSFLSRCFGHQETKPAYTSGSPVSSSI
mmetsp:Transcript_17044/g.53223  ORF Transcript_17044/g.53223 Transcript_17044/m.53223 type:complete len:328 (-) Transcript_17044:329-1312(-)